MTTFPDKNSIVDTLKSQGIDSSYANRFNIDNGRTLCIECHKKTDNYDWKSINIRRKNNVTISLA